MPPFDWPQRGSSERKTSLGVEVMLEGSRETILISYRVNAEVSG